MTKTMIKVASKQDEPPKKQADLVDILYGLKEDKNNTRIKESKEFAFFSHCMIQMGKTHSQCFQDIWVLFESGFKKNGYFVDFGATNGKDDSNSYLLEKEYGWDGIVAEPNPIWYKDLLANRDCNVTNKCVYIETGVPIKFAAIKGKNAPFSTMVGFEDADSNYKSRLKNKQITVDSVSLYDMLETCKAPSLIDYISVDTEGTEYDILEAFFQDNKKYTVDYFTIEHNYHPFARKEIHDMMVAQGYRRTLAYFSRWDDFYVRGT